MTSVLRCSGQCCAAWCPLEYCSGCILNCRCHVWLPPPLHAVLFAPPCAAQVDYEMVNVLDEVHNPGLRDAIKSYSQWPTIPQLFVNGEFIGGTDIMEQMAGSGELAQVLSKAR